MGPRGFTRREWFALAAPPLANSASTEQVRPLAEWRKAAGESGGVVGTSALHLESGKHISLNGSESFPLASVCKLPVALHLLAEVDEGRRRLDGEIEILARDVRPWVSRVAELWPSRTRYPLQELIRLMITESDNTAVDALFRVGGGPAAITARLRGWHITGMRLDRSEGLCNLEAAGIAHLPPEPEWTPAMFDRLFKSATPRMRSAGLTRFLADPRDTATPDATVELLARAFRGELLQKRTTERLIAIMQATQTGDQRLKGLLPPGTVVAHKTGTTATVAGLNGSTNDAGVITLPGGKGHLAVAVYVKASRRPTEVRERIIARIARAAFDAWIV